MSRLPSVGGDSDQWGTVLNDFLRVSLTESGKIKLATWASSANRPSSPVTGETGMNLATGLIEIYDGASWIQISNKVLTSLSQISFTSEYDNGNSGSTKTIDWTQGNKQIVTMTADCTLSFTAPIGPCNLSLRIIQDSTGNRIITWPTMKWQNGSAQLLSSVANTIDILTLYYDGTNYYGQLAKAFA